MDNHKELEKVKREMRSVLMTAKKGIRLKDIEGDYEMLSCSRLPYKDLGFQDVQSFMRSIRDVARETRDGGEIVYQAVADASTAHIKRLVSNQKSPVYKKKKVMKLVGRGNTHHSSKPARERYLSPVVELRKWLKEKKENKEKDTQDDAKKEKDYDYQKNVHHNKRIEKKEDNDQRRNENVRKYEEAPLIDHHNERQQPFFCRDRIPTKEHPRMKENKENKENKGTRDDNIKGKDYNYQKNGYHRKQIETKEDNDQHINENIRKYEEAPLIDLHSDRPQPFSCRVRIPTKEHPKYNFIKHILGRNGSNVKRIEQLSDCKLVILGKGVMKNKYREEKLGGKYGHLNDDPHVLIECHSEPICAYQNIQRAMEELKDFLIPFKKNARYNVKYDHDASDGDDGYFDGANYEDDILEETYFNLHHHDGAHYEDDSYEKRYYNSHYSDRQSRGTRCERSQSRYYDKHDDYQSSSHRYAGSSKQQHRDDYYDADYIAKAPYGSSSLRRPRDRHCPYSRQTARYSPYYDY